MYIKYDLALLLFCITIDIYVHMCTGKQKWMSIVTLFLRAKKLKIAQVIKRKRLNKLWSIYTKRTTQ